MDAARTRRLAERISKIVAEMLERRIKDPRLGFVTVTETRLTSDWREATVFYTVYGSEEERAETAAALRSATGVIRSEVGRLIGLRHTPSIEFVADELPDSARRIDDWSRRPGRRTRNWPAPARARSGPATRTRTRSQPTRMTGTTRTNDRALRLDHRRQAWRHDVP